MKVRGKKNCQPLEYDVNGNRVGFNLYGKGIDEILERGANGTDNQRHWYFFQQNHEGSVTHLTDAAGNVIEQYRYDVFGAPTIYAPNWTVRTSTIYDNRFLFTGREYAASYRGTYNAAFKFYEYRARAYNPILGRFMSEDPKVFDAGDYNLFRYCHNDPVDFTDPMGTSEEPGVKRPPTKELEKIRQRIAQEARDRVASKAYHNDPDNHCNRLPADILERVTGNRPQVPYAKPDSLKESVERLLGPSFVLLRQEILARTSMLTEKYVFPVFRLRNRFPKRRLGIL